MQMSYSNDTIVALATARGQAGVGIVRLSGPEAIAIAGRLVSRMPAPRQASLQVLSDASGEAIDQGIVLCFPAPHSYTGEDVVELQCHGSPVVLDSIVKTVCEFGARLARNGEFSERAFLNDKLDLAQAEAIADLIESGSEAAARAAMRSLQGGCSDAVNTLTTAVTELRMHVEAAIDFPEEEIDFLDDAALLQRIDATREQFDALQAQIKMGQAMTDGLTIVLAGAPNVGKSSLLNQLVGHDAAIVTDIAGTTRDLVRERTTIEGLPVEFVDTAGLHATDDIVELEGIRRSRDSVRTADHSLLMVDANAAGWQQQVASLLDEVPSELPKTVLLNKTDLLTEAVAAPALLDGVPVLAVSARTGHGIAELRQHLLAAAGVDEQQETSFSARRRHVVAITDARAAFDAGVTQLQQFKAGELFAEELRQSQQALAEITGRFTSDDLLGRIFGEFCIGK